MIFPRSLIFALVSAPFLAAAQTASGKPNPPIVPTTGLQATAGQPFTLAWTPTTPGSVSLILRSGASSNLEAGTTIASKISNSGTYTWDVPSSAVYGSDYTIEIVDDADPSQTNYTPYFVLDSTNTVASPSLSSVTLGAPTTSLSMSTAMPTASPSTTGSAASSISGASSTTGSAASTTSHASSSGMTTSTQASSSSSGQAGLIASSTTSAHTGGAPRATAMVGMLGFVALGALAL